MNAARGNAHESFRKLHERYGKVVRTGPNHVAISDPAMIPVIYGTNNRFLKTNFYNSFSTPYEGENMQSLFSTSDPLHHKTLKQAVSSKYSLSSLREFEPKVNECTNLFTAIMREYAASGEVVDLGAWLQWYAFDVIGAITFDRRFGFMDERRDIENIIQGIEGGLWYGCIVGQAPEFHPWLLANPILTKVLLKFEAVREANPVPKVVKMVENAIEIYDERESKETSRSDFLAWFRKEGEKAPGKMPHRDLMNHLMNNLLAGSDTTAISLRAIFYYLIKHPRVHRKLLQEIETSEREGRASANITLAESSQMPYLQACIKEAMRLHPGVGFPLERFAPPEGLTVDDVHIPGGTIVGMNAWVVHHDRSVYGHDADDFRPERWIISSPEQLKMMEKYFLSVGKNISTMEMGMMVPQILREFDISWAAPSEEWRITTFWFAKQTGFHVRLRPKIRKDAAT
ncbi:MAG: hypothetical protein M1819_002501 [Sarea resinae]|nr:MAG: hypothetical protein M1819_002501 [Sarea resinae]